MEVHKSNFEDADFDFDLSIFWNFYLKHAQNTLEVKLPTYRLETSKQQTERIHTNNINNKHRNHRNTTPTPRTRQQGQPIHPTRGHRDQPPKKRCTETTRGRCRTPQRAHGPHQGNIFNAHHKHDKNKRHRFWDFSMFMFIFIFGMGWIVARMVLEQWNAKCIFSGNLPS